MAMMYYFKDIWPTSEEINDVVKQTVTPELFRKEYDNVFGDNERWNEIQTSDEALYTLDEKFNIYSKSTIL